MMSKTPRGMLLCAGLGSRLRPMTERVPKPLVPVLNRPLLLYNLMLLRSAGVRELVINLHHLGHMIREVLGDGRELELEISYSEEPTLLGTGGGLYAMREFLAQGTSIIANGDTLCSLDLRAALKRHQERRALATMILYPHPDPEPFGAVRLDQSGRVVAIGHLTEDPSGSAVSSFLFAGVHFLEPGFFEHLSDQPPSCVVRTAYRELIEAGAPVYGDASASCWHDCGTPTRYIEASRALLASPEDLAHLAPPPHHPAQIGRNVTITEPVLFGPDVKIGDGARVGPDVVLGEGVTIGANTQLQRSVVWPGAHAEGLVQDQIVV